MTRIRLLLVDDHQIVRAGLRMLFMAEKDMEIVGEVGSGDEAITAVRQLKPDVVLMDVVMSGMRWPRRSGAALRSRGGSWKMTCASQAGERS